MRIVVCDDHPVVVMGVKALLAGEGGAYQVVGEAHGGPQLLQLLERLPCDLLVTDFSMPGATQRDDGLPLLRRVLESHPRLPIVVLTMIHNAALVRAMLKLGVRGIVDKAGMMNELLQAVKAVQAGRTFLSVRAQAQIDAQAAEAAAPHAAPASALSVREAEVVRLYARGMTVTEIAETVQRSVKTVSKQKNDAMHKLGLESNRQLYEFARANGLLS